LTSAKASCSRSNSKEKSHDRVYRRDSLALSILQRDATGVFLTGSDTSSNALCGNLQVVTANALGLNPILTASTNAATGVMGKMISLQSIAVAVATTGMAASEEGRLFRITLKHSIALALFMAVVTMIFAYVLPDLVPQVNR